MENGKMIYYTYPYYIYPYPYYPYIKQEINIYINIKKDKKQLIKKRSNKDW